MKSIRDRRLALGISQQELADLAKLSQQLVSMAERDPHVVSDRSLEDIFDTLANLELMNNPTELRKLAEDGPLITSTLLVNSALAILFLGFALGFLVASSLLSL